MLRLYSVGAYEVKFLPSENPEAARQDRIVVHLPVALEGVSAILCHNEGNKTSQLIHGWDEACSQALEAAELTEKASPGDLQNRIGEQDERFRSLKDANQPVTPEWIKWAEKHGLKQQESS